MQIDIFVYGYKVEVWTKN